MGKIQTDYKQHMAASLFPKQSMLAVFLLIFSLYLLMMWSSMKLTTRHHMTLAIRQAHINPHDTMDRVGIFISKHAVESANPTTN